MLFVFVVVFVCSAISIEANVCPAAAECNEKTSTCCPLPKKGVYGCCNNYLNATCCPDTYGCCPEGFSCYKNRCRQSHKHVPQAVTTVAPQPKSKVLNSNDDEDAKQCGKSIYYCNKSYKCCKTGSSYMCCKYNNGQCCENGKSCCAHGDTCSSDGKRCTSSADIQNKYSFSTRLIKGKMRGIPDVLRNKRAVPDLVVDANNTCNSNEKSCSYQSVFKRCCPTCCTTSNNVLCCPVYNGLGVCCKDTNYCCPNKYKCQESNSTISVTSTVMCVLSSSEGLTTTSFPALKTFASTIDKVELMKSDACLSNGAICKQQGKCCPLKDGTCCPNGRSCCPKGYSCNRDNCVLKQL